MNKDFLMKKRLKLIVIFFWLPALIGCSVFNKKYSQPTLLQAKSNVSLFSSKLAAHGVGVDQSAESLKITLPNREVFLENSTNFTGKADEIVDLILYLTSCYQEATIAIIGYAGGDDEISMALAKERAHKIMQRLWQPKISSNFVYANSKNSLINCTVVEIRIYPTQSFV